MEKISNWKDYEDMVKRELKGDVVRFEDTLIYKLQKELKQQYCERVDCMGRLGNSKKVEELKASVKYYVDILTDLKKWLEEEKELKGSETAHLYYGKVLEKIKELEDKYNA